MLATRRAGLALCELAVLFNLGVLVFAWDFFGLFHSAMPPVLGIAVVTISLLALITTLGAASRPRGRPGLRGSITALTCIGTWLTVIGELVLLSSEDGYFGGGLLLVAGGFLHLLVAALLVALSLAHLESSLPTRHTP